MDYKMSYGFLKITVFRRQEMSKKTSKEKKEKKAKDEYAGLNESQIAHIERMKKLEA